MTKEKKVHNLVIFPGDVFPLNMGARRRVYNLIYHLNKSRILIDILIVSSRQPNKLFKKEYDLLVENVYFISSKQKRPSLYHRILNKFKQIISKPKNQESFTTRVKRKRSLHAQKECESLINKNNYSNVIVSYAWMMWIVENYSDSKYVNIICDTYDVQYKRNESILAQMSNNVDFLKDKESELSYLKKANFVMVISKNDFSELNQYIDSKKLILCTIDFDYIFKNIAKKPSGQSLSFGFIGNNMIANKLSINKILNIWWPIILESMPEAKLYIAGSICNIIDKKIYKNIRLENNVEFVDSFYEKIDCLLFPNSVRGGLNIKLYESLFSNKYIISDDNYIHDDIKNLIIKWDADNMSFTLNKILNDDIRNYHLEIEKIYKTSFQSEIVYKKIKKCIKK